MKRFIRPAKNKKSDEGMTLAITLVMGLMLSAAAGGLLAQQMMLRRTGTAESYKQMAEMAAASGMNRLLASLNNPGPTSNNQSTDLSYLWGLDHDNNFQNEDLSKQKWFAGNLSELDQPCQLTSTSQAAAFKITEGTINGGENLREDGRESSIQAEYRLRNYKKDGTAAIFDIEGYTTQNSGEKVLSRSLLVRILSLEKNVVSPDHWGVIAGRRLNLGNTQINGEGLTLWLMDESQSQQKFPSLDACSSGNLAAAVGSSNSSMNSKIWPSVSNDNQFPSPSIFADSNVHEGQLNIDAREYNPIASSGTQISSAETVKRNSNGDVTNIHLSSKYLCEGKNDKPCIVKIEALNLNSATLSIETDQKPVILRLVEAKTQFDLAQGSLCQANESSAWGCDSSAKPARLVIYAPDGEESESCRSGTNNLFLRHKDALPSGVVLMPKAKVQISGSPTMKGLLWSHAICAEEGGITLNTHGVITDFKKQWDPSFAFGRLSWRGIRGKQHDVFRSW